MVGEVITQVPPTPDSLAGTAEMVSLLREQVSLYGRLEKLASRQQSLVADEDTGPLLTLLAQRQKLSAELAGMRTRLEPIRRDWDRHRDGLSGAERVEADRLLKETRRLLRNVIQRDEEDARLLAARKEAIAVALRSSHSTEQALSAYRAPDGDSGRISHLDEAT